MHTYNFHTFISPGPDPNIFIRPEHPVCNINVLVLCKLPLATLSSSCHGLLLVCVCVCVCVCGLVNPTLWGQNKDGNIRNPCPCGDIFWSP